MQFDRTLSNSATFAAMLIRNVSTSSSEVCFSLSVVPSKSFKVRTSSSNAVLYF